MEGRSLEYIAEACGGELTSGSPKQHVARVCTDSRQAQPGDLFIPLAGEKFDGHNFLPEAARKGAAAAITNRAYDTSELPEMGIIKVENTRKALGELAGRYREDFPIPSIAVCGSNGKTTTKELIASVLRKKLPTLHSEGSFNNDVGVPLSLLRLERLHKVAVIEAGTNHPGELAPLLKMIAAKYAVVTNIGREHLEFFGDVEGVAFEEGTAAELLPQDGRLFLNGDDPFSAVIAARTKAPVTRVGLSTGNDFRAVDIRIGAAGAVFRVETRQGVWPEEFRINIIGRHQVMNALFAIALGEELGVPRTEIQTGLRECVGQKWRMQALELNGVTILNDAYNANADSMTAALETLNELPCRGRKIAVLGDMAELGHHSEAAHDEVGRRAAALGVGQLFAVGKMAGTIARAARAGGLNRVIELADVESAAGALKTFLRPGDMLLLKGSRSGKMERIAELLKAKA